METLVGLTTTREVYADLLGVPLLGAAFSYTLTSPTGVVLLNNVPAPEVGGGFYAVTVDGSQYLTSPGLYREAWVGQSGTIDLPLSSQFLVGYEVGPVVTRLELRHSVAGLLGDLWTGIATSATPTSLVDPDRVEIDNAWQGAQLYIYGGTGAGQARNLLSSAQSSGALVIGKPWTVIPDATARYELHRRFSCESYNRALNEAIRTIADRPLLRAVDETITLTAGVYEYPVPAGFSHISKLSTKSLTGNGDWAPLRWRDDWSLVPGLGRLHIASPAGSLRLRLEGHLAPPALLRDAAYADTSPEYLKYQAACILAQSQIASPGRDLEAAAQASAYYRDQAKELFPRQHETANARPVL